MKGWTIALTALGLGVLALGVALLLELRRVPTRPATARGQAEAAPLTDVAGPARRTWPPPPAGATPPPAPSTPLEEVVAVPPSLMPDPANPPQGTTPLVVPGPPTPPDPMVAPAIAQDPDRGGRTE